MSNILQTRIRNPQYFHLYKKCVNSYQTAIDDLALYRYSECLWNKFEVLEFFWKAIYFLQNGSYPPKHLPEFQDFNLVSTFLQNYLKVNTLGKIQSIFTRNNPSWQRNPQQRMQPRYGDERKGLPPSQLYNQKIAKRAINDCYILARELVNIHRAIVLNQNEIFVGILNGSFSPSRKEIKCNKAPWAEISSIKSWSRYLSKI